MKRAVKNALKKCVLRLFHIGQRLGVDILPRHFYSEIPDIRKLKASEHWRKPFSMIGIAGIDVDEQMVFVNQTVPRTLAATLPKLEVHQKACASNGEPGYGRVEADFLYAFVSQYRPAKIMQIGCGVSTAICLAAAKAANYRPEIICIEPYPTTFLKQAEAAGEIRLIEKPVELLEYQLLDELGEGDFFFVDSTHTLGPGGEVSRIILEMLPRLAQGVYIHFHDIVFPYDYQGDILDSALFFWHETSLLHAFLTGNANIKVLACLSMLHHAKQTELQNYLPNYQPRVSKLGVTVCEGDFPSSIYLQVLKSSV
jgi:Methyltransferase domain